MTTIRRTNPKIDSAGNIIPKQESCATCKKRSICDTYRNKMKEVTSQNNEMSELVLAMYYICDDYDAMFIKYPIVVENIFSDLAYDKNDPQERVGDFVICVLNDTRYDENVHLGLYLGDMPMSIISLFDPTAKEVRNKFMKNPAMYLFKFKKIFYGMNNRWNFISSMRDIDIIDKDDPQEYVSIAKSNLNSDEKSF